MKKNIFIETIRLLRPKQWTKNMFVFAGVIFSKNFFNLILIEKTLLAFLFFCMISSSVYVLNDMIDVNKDKIHPKKKDRPLATGTIKMWQAGILLLILSIVSIIFSFKLNEYFGYIIITYFTMNTLYSLKLKHIVIVDIMIIATGFVLRAVSGAVVIDVLISPWLLICTIFLALFLALNKRKNELLVLDENAKEHRKILDEYSIELINQMLPIVTSGTIISYALYTFTGTRTVAMMVTIPFVLYGVFRYQYLALNKGMGGSPELVLLKDAPLIINIMLWGLTSITILYLKK